MVATQATARWHRSVSIAAAVFIAIVTAAYAVKFFARPSTVVPVVVEGDGIHGPRDMVWVPGGEFLMGSDHRLAQANERPAHKVRVHPFWMDKTHVTNAQFAAFVNATGYVTTAERALVPGAMVFVGSEQPVPLDDWSRWWAYVPGADWRHPQGPMSTIIGKHDHPVVQVSYQDALAYARWAGKRLPTEAEWEFAARGGLEQATYAWGDDLMPQDKPMANIWDAKQERFPVVSAKADGAAGTSPAGSFPPNGYGLYDMTGNAWQWVADWYRYDYFRMQTGLKVVEDPEGPSSSYDPEDRGAPANAAKRVTRGGSFLCNVDYCLSYRPSARRGTDPYNPMSHIGFRLVMDEAQWKQSR